MRDQGTPGKRNTGQKKTLRKTWQAEKAPRRTLAKEKQEKERRIPINQTRFRKVENLTHAEGDKGMRVFFFSVCAHCMVNKS